MEQQQGGEHATAQQELDGNGAGLEHGESIGEAAGLAQALPEVYEH